MSGCKDPLEALFNRPVITEQLLTWAQLQFREVLPPGMSHTSHVSQEEKLWTKRPKGNPEEQLALVPHPVLAWVCQQHRLELVPWWRVWAPYLLLFFSAMLLTEKASNQSSKLKFCKGIIYLKSKSCHDFCCLQQPNRWAYGAAHGLKEK